MRNLHELPSTGLADLLIENWLQQDRDGFLLSGPDSADLEIRYAEDKSCGVNYRFLWMPHREVRGDIAALEHRGILNRDRDESKLHRDPRDPHGRHCFLCASNIRECHPKEVLIPLRLAGQPYYAGANFAWIERDHYTVMTADHVDQLYSHHVLEAMLDLHWQTEGRFRVLFNGPGAGATIPWHRHYQITTASMPIEDLAEGCEGAYPTLVWRFRLADGGSDGANAAAIRWLEADTTNHTLNLLISGPVDDVRIYVFPRDQRRAKATNKGLVGGFEVAGDFVLSAPGEKWAFDHPSPETARSMLEQVRPLSAEPDSKVA